MLAFGRRQSLVQEWQSSAAQGVGGQPRIHKILPQTNKMNGLRNSGVLQKPKTLRKAITASRSGQLSTDGSYVSKLSAFGVLGL